MTTPNAIIFRIPKLDEHAVASFCMALLDEDGTILPETETFTVLDADGYLAMTYGQIVFVEAYEGGSRDLVWISILDEAGELDTVHQLDLATIQAAVTQVLSDEDITFEPVALQ